MKIVAAVFHPLRGNGTTRQQIFSRVIESALMRPLPGLQAGNSFALNFRHALTTLAVMLGAAQIQESSTPKARLIHRVQVVADGVIAPKLHGKHTGNLATQLRGQGRPKVTLHSLRDSGNRIHLG